MNADRDVWSLPALAARSTGLGLLIFMITGVALVPLANRMLQGVFWIGVVINLVLFVGYSLGVPLVLLRQYRSQTATAARSLVFVISYALGWLVLPCLGVILFVRPDVNIPLGRWQLPLLFGMISSFMLMAVFAAFVSRRGGQDAAKAAD